MANQPQCDSVVWQRKEVTDASLSREGGDIRICWITVLEDSAHAFASGAKMWQWGNSVTAYCVMSPWFLSYCAGDEREKNGEQRIQHMMKGSPCWWGICEALFKKAGWQRMRRRRRKNGWAQREKYIRPIVQLKRGSTQQTGGGGGERDAVRTTSRLRSNIYQSPSIQSPRACRGWLYRPRNQLTFSVASTFGLNLFFFFFFGDEDTNTGEGAVRREGRGGWGETKTKWAIPDKKNKTRGGFSNICMWIDAALHRQQRWGLYVIADEQCHRAGRLGEGQLRGSRDENHLYFGGGARAVWLCKSKFDCNLRRWFTLRK